MENCNCNCSGNVVNITAAGLGGQGVLTVTDILAEILFNLNYDVKKSEVHGMSQRGGSVSSEVRYGKKVASPMIPDGESDILVILEQTQVEVNLQKLRSGGILITPDDIPLSELKNPKSINIMILGALANILKDIDYSLWIEAIKNNLPEKLHESNLKMFDLGYNYKKGE